MAQLVEKLGAIDLNIRSKIKAKIKGANGQANGVDDLYAAQRQQIREQEIQEEKRQKERQHLQERQERLEALEEIQADEPEDIKDRYGVFEPTQIGHPSIKSTLEDLSVVGGMKEGDEVAFRARLHTKRAMSSKLVFFLFRRDTIQIQGVLTVRKGAITENMVRWTEHLPGESVVLVSGRLQKPVEDVQAASIHHLELSIERLYAISRPTRALPFSTYLDEAAHKGSEEEARKEDSENGSEENLRQRKYISDRVRLNNRILDLREPASNTIFRVKAEMCRIFRSYLDELGFMEIHTAKLQGGATESGASVFKVDYFERPAFLAQSPQLAKQMAISSDLGRVYEIGPVFRAENSNTHRHLTEYTGLDLEMQINEHYYEMLDVVDGLFKRIWKGVYERFGEVIPNLESRFPHEKLVWLDETPRIPFKEGVKMLADSGWTDDDDNPPSEEDDLSTPMEIRLGELVKEKYGTDYYILDKFPASARPFYTMPDPENPKFTNSFDIMLRGQEIVSGGQRIHDVYMLEEKMRQSQIHPESLDDYVEGFRLGAPPHAGAGIGLERIVMLLLCLGDVRWATLNPRDPKSIPEKPKIFQLRHPDSNTLEFALKPRTRNVEVEVEPPPLDRLIANYGDAANTSWLDERYCVWRHKKTGAAQGYVPSHMHAIVVGEPLCDRSQLAEVMPDFINFLKKEVKLRPIWILVGVEVQDILGRMFGWRTLTCIAENRAKTNDHAVRHDQVIRRKIRHADREGVKIVTIPPGEEIKETIRQEIDECIKAWLGNRQGTQVHLTQINPWIDMYHRRYLYAKSKEGKIVALVVLHQLSMQNGYQVKFALDFPGAPNGTIEAITLEAMDLASDEGATSVTFGTSATKSFSAMHNLDGLRVKMMSKLYESIIERLKLTQKGEFREKLGAREDSSFICFPSGSMGPKGIKALSDFLQSED